MATMISGKASYFLTSAARFITRHRMACPSCGSLESTVVDRKFVVTRLMRCHKCRLLFRSPTTLEGEFTAYYQQQYAQGFTTEVPTETRLSELKATKFEGTEKDYSSYLAVLRSLGCMPSARLFDFGCSWGYGTWQLTQAGFAVEAYELSEPRRKFATDSLGVTVLPDLASISGPYDIFFSAHVLEHVPNLDEVIAFARRVLRPGGLFVAFTPNGSAAYRTRNPGGWHTSWGFVHPLMLDEAFYRARFSRSPFVMDTSPYNLEEISRWTGQKSESQLGKMSGSELFIAVRF